LEKEGKMIYVDKMCPEDEKNGQSGRELGERTVNKQ
jgi:hypothetical protein